MNCANQTKSNKVLSFMRLRDLFSLFRPSDLITTLKYVVMDNFCPCLYLCIPMQEKGLKQKNGIATLFPATTNLIF